MEIRFDPRLNGLPRIQKKKDREGQKNAFEQALQNEEGHEEQTLEEGASATRGAESGKKGQKPRNDDGKGLKVDLLA